MEELNMSRRPRREFTEEFKLQMVKLYNNGKPIVEIVKEYDLTRSAFMNWIQKYNKTGSFKACDNRTEEEKELIKQVVQFIDSLRVELVPELNEINKANKATVGTFFSVRNPKQAMRSFGAFVSVIDWSKSESLNELFSPFMLLGEEKDDL